MIYGLLVTNICVYLLMFARTGRFEWGARTLFAWGGNLGVVSLHGQPWRLLTAMFLHAGFPHILGNMVLLLITGTFLQKKLGGVRLVAVYLVSGLAGSVLSAAMHPEIVSIGASGAIAGLLGTMVTLKLWHRAPEVSGIWMLQVIGLNALYSFAPNVDGLAHLGGFAVGLAAGAVVGAGITPMTTGAGEV